jgi:hypothetical protein
MIHDGQQGGRGNPLLEFQKAAVRDFAHAQ